MPNITKDIIAVIKNIFKTKTSEEIVASFEESRRKASEEFLEKFTEKSSNISYYGDTPDISHPDGSRRSDDELVKRISETPCGKCIHYIREFDKNLCIKNLKQRVYPVVNIVTGEITEKTVIETKADTCENMRPTVCLGKYFTLKESDTHTFMKDLEIKVNDYLSTATLEEIEQSFRDTGAADIFEGKTDFVDIGKPFNPKEWDTNREVYVAEYSSDYPEDYYVIGYFYDVEKAKLACEPIGIKRSKWKFNEDCWVNTDGYGGSYNVYAIEIEE